LSYTNGETTTNNLSALSITGLWFSIVWGNGRYVATHYSGHVITSENGIDWVYRGTRLRDISTGDWMGGTWDGEKFMSVCANGYIATSPDGISWKSGGNSLTSIGSNWRQVVYQDGVYIALARSGTVYTPTSVDGIKWINQGSGLGTIAPIWSGCMNFQNGKILAISHGTQTADGSYEGEIKFTNITGDTANHIINRRTEFYIEPSQMT
jgi:hypothetical protein